MLKITYLDPKCENGKTTSKVYSMNIEELRNYCLAKKGTTEEFPFDNDTLVFKVMGKMYALTSLKAEQFSINLKCDPEKAIQLREEYTAVQPGYHMSKKHWNTVYADGSVPDKTLRDWIDHSYKLVADKLPKKLKDQINP